MFCQNGIKYFINLCSLNNNMYLPIEIRQIIWNYSHIVDVIKCSICNKILFYLNINLLYKNDELIDNYSIINGLAKCNKCYID